MTWTNLGSVDIGATSTDAGVSNRPSVNTGNLVVYGTFNIDPSTGTILFPAVLQAYAASTINLIGTYNNGVNGVGATLTLTATGLIFIDGIGFLGMVVLLKDQTTQIQNGLYVITNTGGTGVSAVLQRSFAMNSPAQFIGTEIAICAGNVNFGKTYTANFGVNTVGTSAITYGATPWTVDDSIALSFGSTARQMVNLYGTTYAIGVQSFTQYFRTDPAGGFAFFTGGIHSNAQNAPGTGGSVAGVLNASGLVIPSRMSINNGLALHPTANVKLYVGGTSLFGQLSASTVADADVTAIGQAAYMCWNRTGGQGECDFVNHHGGGVGGWYFYDTDGTTWTLPAKIDNKGNHTAASFCSNAVVHASAGTALTLDFTAGMFHTFKLTVGSNCVITFTLPTTSGMLYIRADGATSTLPVITWNSAGIIKGTALATTVSATKSSLYCLFWDGTSLWNMGTSLQSL